MIDIHQYSTCEYCSTLQQPNYKFCSSCGKQNKSVYIDSIKKRGEKDRNTEYLLSYAIIGIVIAIIFYFVDDFFWSTVLATSIFAAIDLIFAYKQPIVFQLFKIDRIKPLVVAKVILICISSGFLVHFSVDYINELTLEFSISPAISYELYFPSAPILAALFFNAVCPAIFEELAFRGFLFNNFLTLSGKRAAVFGSSFLFAIIHFSLFSLFWLFPFALYLSYLRLKHKTLLYGILAHFTHNLTVTLIEFYL